MIITKDFYFFRHGQTDWNKKRICQGHTDIALNDLGRTQAYKLKELFHAQIEAPEVFYSSDLSRAKETAEIVNEGLGREIILTRNLRETHLGELEGMEITQARERVGTEVWSSFKLGMHSGMDISFPNGESRAEVIDRFKKVIIEILNETEYSKIGISTHGGAMRNFLHCLVAPQTPELIIPNCVVYHVKLNLDKSALSRNIELIFDLDHYQKFWSVHGPILNQDS